MKTTRSKNIIKEASKVISDSVDTLKKASKKKTETKPIVKKKAEPIVWDYPLGMDISFFDASLSYEISGYRPITKTEGLDFDPEWFVEARNNYLSTGHYTQHIFGSKGYRDFWHEEYKRCRNGYTVNGYTVTGEHYFFLNYYNLPIIEEGKKASSGRQKSFPKFFVSQYQYFHYVDIAKKLHKHIALMKARGVGFSEVSASMAANQYTTIRESITMIACYDKGKLERTLSKVWDALKFLDSNTDGGMFKLRQLSDTAFVKKSGHYNTSKGNKTPAGWQSTVEGVVADDPQKIRGDRVDLMVLDEAGCHAPGTEVLMYDGSLKKVEDVVIGDVLMGDDGTPRNVLELHNGTSEMYKITPSNGDVQIVNKDHLVYCLKDIRGTNDKEEVAIKVSELYNKSRYKGSNYLRNYWLVKSDKVSFPKEDVPIDPYLLGLWLGRGLPGSPCFFVKREGVEEFLQDYAEDNGYSLEFQGFYYSRICKMLRLRALDGDDMFVKSLMQLGIYHKKDIPDSYMKNSRDVLLDFLAGFIDSNAEYNSVKDNIVCYARTDDEIILLEKVWKICKTLGLKVSSGLSKEYAKGIKSGKQFLRFRILSNTKSIPCRAIGQMRKKPKTKGSPLLARFKIEKHNVGEYYGFGVDGNHLFLLRDYTVCHNSWNGLLKAFVQAQALVEVQGVAFGAISLGGTGGDKGANLDGLRTIYYNPEPYGVLPYRHNYTSDGSQILSGYFIPAFTQSMVSGMVDHRGYCDEEANKAHLQKNRDQYLSVPQSLIHHCAEYCWNAEEAFALEGDNKFNKVLLSEQLAQIRLHKTGPRPTKGYIDYIYKDGRHDANNISGFKWVPTKEGKVEILEHPVWSELFEADIKRKEREANAKGIKFERPPAYKEMNDLYVAGVDGIDIGKNQTSSETKGASEFCIIIYKRAFGLNEPQIVCMYKDRPNEVRTAYKTAMCLLRYYNCKVNVEATRVGFINWARYSNQLKWFMRRPQATLQNIKNGNSKSYGTPATRQIIEMQTDLIAEFIEDYCHTIWFEDVLDQMVRYSIENKTKFDIIAALGMVMLADQELSGRSPVFVTNVDDTFEDFGYYIDDNGYRQWGIIPKQKNHNILYGGGQAYDPYRLETSDTRYHQEYDQ